MTFNWHIVRLGDVLSQYVEPFSVKAEETYTSLGVKWYAEGVFVRAAKHGSEIKAARLYRVKSRQFIYNRMFATEGSFALVPENLAYGVVSNEFPVFDLDEKVIIPEFLVLHFQQKRVWDYVSQECVGTTKSRNRWKEERFLAYRISLPSVDEQRRIVDLVDSLDDAIEATEIRAMRAREVYRDLIQGLARDVELIPLGSVLKSVKSGGTPSRQKPEYFDGLIPWVKSGEVDRDSIGSSEEHITEAALLASAAWIVPVGATLVAMYGQGNTKGTAGLVTSPVSTNQAVLALVPDEDRILPTYLLHAVRSRARSLRSKAVGAAQPNLSKRIIIEEPIPLPSLEQQSVVSSACSAIQDVVYCAKEQVESLRKIRSELLVSLLSGVHTIPDSYDSVMVAKGELVTA